MNELLDSWIHDVLFIAIYLFIVIFVYCYLFIYCYLLMLYLVFLCHAEPKLL